MRSFRPPPLPAEGKSPLFSHFVMTDHRWKDHELCNTGGKRAYLNGDTAVKICPFFQFMTHNGNACVHGERCRSLHLKSLEAVAKAGERARGGGVWWQYDQLHLVDQNADRYIDVGARLRDLSDCELRQLRPHRLISHQGLTTPLRLSSSRHQRRTIEGVVIAIDPPQARLLEDAFQCELLKLKSGLVVAFTSFTPNFIDSALTDGRLTPALFDAARVLQEQHYIGVPVKLWEGGGQAAESSLSTTRVIGAIAATRHYDLELRDNEPCIVGVSALQPPEPLRLVNVRLSHRLDIATTDNVIMSSIIAGARAAANDPVTQALRLACAVTSYEQGFGGAAGQLPRMKNTPAVGCCANIPKDANNSRHHTLLYLEYRNLSSLSHLIVKTGTQLTNTIATAFLQEYNPTESFVVQDASPLSTAHLRTLTAMARQGPGAALDAKHLKTALLSAGVNMSVAKDVLQGRPTQSVCTMLADVTTPDLVECTTPLRSFGACYHQLLILEALDPDGPLSDARKGLLEVLPHGDELRADVAKKLTSLHVTQAKRSVEILRGLAEAFPDVVIPVRAFVARMEASYAMVQPILIGSRMIKMPRTAALGANTTPDTLLWLEVPLSMLVSEGGSGLKIVQQVGSDSVPCVWRLA